MVLGGGALGGGSLVEVRALMLGLALLEEETPETACLLAHSLGASTKRSCEHTVRRQLPISQEERTQ